jgi:hypothetical protein
VSFVVIVPAFLVGKRNCETTEKLIDDLATRIVLPENPNIPWSGKPRLSTDGWASYGVIVKNYENPEVALTLRLRFARQTAATIGA